MEDLGIVGSARLVGASLALRAPPARYASRAGRAPVARVVPRRRAVAARAALLRRLLSPCPLRVLLAARVLPPATRSLCARWGGFPPLPPRPRCASSGRLLQWCVALTPRARRARLAKRRRARAAVLAAVGRRRGAGRDYARAGAAARVLFERPESAPVACRWRAARASRLRACRRPIMHSSRFHSHVSLLLATSRMSINRRSQAQDPRPHPPPFGGDKSRARAARLSRDLQLPAGKYGISRRSKHGTGLGRDEEPCAGAHSRGACWTHPRHVPRHSARTWVR